MGFCRRPLLRSRRASCSWRRRPEEASARLLLEEAASGVEINQRGLEVFAGAAYGGAYGN